MLAPEKHVYEDPNGVVLRARLCTRVYTVVYTRVHTTPLGEGCVPGASSPQSTDTPRAQIPLSAVDAPRLASPRPLVISCALL